MAGDLQELAQKAGMWATVTERTYRESEIDGRVVAPTGPSYVVALRDREGSRPASACWDWKAEWVENHQGMVRCVTVPNESLYVRRNGIPAWCGNTMTPFPAFQEAQLNVLNAEAQATDVALVASGVETEGEVWRFVSPYPMVARGSNDVVELTSLVASAAAPSVIPVNPPQEWFSLLEMDEPQPFTVYPDGRCYGLVAKFGTCHIGSRDRCVEVPHSANNYRNFRNKNTLTQEGELVATGPIFMDTVHPNLRLVASDAEAHYADTGCAVADVALYENEFGIVAAGAVRPDATPEQIRRLRGSDISPDWRMMGRHRNEKRLEVVGLLAVNVSGFIVEGLAASGGEMNVEFEVERMIPRARVNTVSGEVEALVAAGSVRQCSNCGTHGVDQDSMTSLVEMLARHENKLNELFEAVRPIRAERMAARFTQMAISAESLDGPKETSQGKSPETESQEEPTAE